MSVAPVSAAQTPVRLKMRGDLSADRQRYQGVEYWVIKEPIGQKYYQFPPHVYFLLQQLDGSRTVEQIIDRYHDEFAPKRIDREQLQQLLQRFHKDGLVISDLPGQGTELLKRGKKNKRMEWFSKLSNILAIRFRGFDPDRLLARMNPYTSWLFTKPTAIIVGVLATIALFSVLSNWAEFNARLPGFDQFFDLKKWYLFAGVLAFTKIFHEFGHGLSCKKFGGECHEIGFMLLVMTPCLYCNVSDSWRLPNKWQRATIGAAGMYIEIILATIATFVWWFAQPGLVQEICLQIMLVSSVSTVLFNGNPLLRFDGYYIISDLLEIPNLHQKSNTALTTLMGRHWLGMQLPDDPLLPRNRMVSFALFTVTAFIYRFVVLFSILMFLTRWLEPYGLESIGQGIAWMSLLGMVGMPTYKLYRFFSVPGRLMQMKPKRFTIGTICILLVLGAIFFVPFPSNLSCRVLVVPKTLEAVYARQSGAVVDLAVTNGQRVEVNQVLARLENLPLKFALTEKQNALEKLTFKRDAALRIGMLGFNGGQSLADVSAFNEEIQKLQKSIDIERRQLAWLEIRSPVAGTVVATPLAGELPGKFETPLEDRQPVVLGFHDGITIRRGERFCEIADLDQWEAIILLTERQVKFTELGQKTRIRLHALPGTTLETEIQTIGVADRLIQRQGRDEDPDALQSKIRVPDLVSELVAKVDQESVQYIAKAPIESKGVALQIGLDGQGRLRLPNRSLAQRLWWWFNENFGS
ncbi:MAG: hypothetical protein ABL888_02100 [Pirellulaceae bacterium]